VALPFDPAEIAARWRDDRRYRADLTAPNLRYHLAEFPYPSADGLHVGHVFKYGGLDVYSRYWRMRGAEVFQPIGFDSFGIHTENFALRIGEHPARVTERTIANFRRQLSSVGIGWDWSRSITTSDPAYYRWTQWVFVRLFRAGLAYHAEAPVIWCPSCLTVLAREQVEGDRCERCDAVVEERVMCQWFLRTTSYAARLHAGLDGVDWPAKAKNRQRRWIDQLRDWLISRQRYWGPPIPIVHCPSCGPVPVPEDQLPVLLPDVDDFRPAGTGVSPLAAVESWVCTTCPACGGAARRETDVSDTFLDSAWYFLRYPCTDLTDRPWDPTRVRPADFLAGGPEHVTRHHLYARFVTMAMHDEGLVPFEEPFPYMRLGGLLNHDGMKMSKSRGNVVSPDDYVAAHGADVLRMALLFSGRWEEGGDFTDAAVVGIERFLGRVWRRVVDGDPSGEVDSPVIDVVGRAYDTMRFNVAIARLMETWPRLDARTLVLLLAPLAPDVTGELWHRLGGAGNVHDQAWPALQRTRHV
jgi:leucyl-tRNA synthetase